MADAIVQIALEGLNSVIIREINLIYGVRDDLSKLSETLSTIRDVLADAERRQIREKPIANWLTKLKHAAYDADDVLDEWLTGVDQVSTSSSSCLNSMNLLFCRKMAKKIKKMLNIFEELRKQMRDFMLNSGPFPEMHSQFDNNRETTSLISEPLVYGRDGDKEKITHMLLNNEDGQKEKITHMLLNNEDGQKNVTIFPIVGMGGLGKTTLAQLVFNDERIEKFFDPKIWVCVCEPFDIRRVLKAIIESFDKKHCDLETLEAIENKVRGILKKKKYLLVLDDVWNEEQNKWNKLTSALAGGAQGSSIILTTRSLKVASITGNVPSYNLGSLSDDDCWLLMKNCAFGDSIEEERNLNLVPIGKAIAKRCKGLPLVAKTLGGLLGLKTEEVHWNHVKDNEIWNLEDGSENSILLALRLSYDHLHPCLKQCFAFCSIYPKDYKLEREKLINLWIGNGYIQSQGSKDLEEIANDVFSELLQRSFFQDAQEDVYGNIAWCKMHDLLHDLAISVSVDESLFLEVDKSIEHVPTTIRHLGVISNSPQSFTPQQSLRTLVFFDSINFDSFKFSSTLRVLDLSSTEIETFPPSICHLKLLRYLDLSHNDVLLLPKSICELRNLQTLDLSFNRKLETLPSSIVKLEHLRYLNVSSTSITSIPDSFNMLKNLRYLSLSSTRITTLSPDSFSMMKNLQWLDLSENAKMTTLPPSLGNLENLKYLNVCSTGITSLPDSILKLPNLQTLDLSQNSSLETLPPSVGNLKHLRYIGLSTCLTSLPDFLHRLTNLSKLDLSQNSKITTLSPSIGNLVCLRYLDISGCSSLRTLPETVCHLINLESLLLRGCYGLEQLPETMGKLTSLKHLDIHVCVKLRNMPIGFGQLTCLQTLSHFIVGEPDREGGVIVGINELRTLNQLRRRLEIHRLENVRNAAEAATANLGSKQYVTELKLVWVPYGSLQVDNKSKEVLECLLLHPPPNLQVLEIRGYDAEELPPQIFQGEGLGGVPLRSLTMRDCRKLIRLPVGIKDLTKLTSLKIWDCEKLISLPTGIGNLTRQASGTSGKQFVYRNKNLGMGEPNLPVGRNVLSKIHQTRINHKRLPKDGTGKYPRWGFSASSYSSSSEIESHT